MNYKGESGIMELKIITLPALKRFPDGNMGHREHIPWLLLSKSFLIISQVAIVIYVVNFLENLHQLTQNYRVYYIQFAYQDEQMTERKYM